MTSRRARPIAFSAAGLMAGLGLLAWASVPPPSATITPWSAAQTPRGVSPSERCRSLIKEGRAHEAEVLASDLVARAGDGDSLEAAEALDLLGDALKAGGKWRPSQALTSARRALEIRERLLGVDHPDVLPSLMTVAHLTGWRGDHAAAVEFAARALALATRVRGPEHPDVSEALHLLAIKKGQIGDIAAAIRLHEQALAIREKTLGPDHPDVAATLTALSWIQGGNGDYDAARDAAARAVAIREKTLGPNHSSLALSINTLANLHRNMGAYASARPLYERAIAIWSGPPVHDNLANALIGLALMLSKIGEHDSALRHAERALALRTARLGADNDMVARALRDLATIRWAAGDAAGTRPLLERALDIQERRLGTGHPLLAQTLDLLALAELRLGDRESAFEHSIQAEEIARHSFRQTAQVLSERQILQYEAVRTSGFDVAVSVLVEASLDEYPRDAVRRVWDEVILSRAMALDELGARHGASVRGQTPEIQELARALADARRMLVHQAVQGSEGGASRTYAAELRSAREAMERAERALAEASVPFRRKLEHARIGHSEVSAALPPHSALVAYLTYRNPASNASSYVAFVLPSGRDTPEVVPLGPAESIHALLERWRQAVGAQPAPHRAWESGRHHALGRDLRSRIWDPVARAIGDATTVFVIPDGALNLVSLAALPAVEGRFLVEDGPVFHYLSAERDLLREDPAEATGAGLLALGGPDFDGRDAVQAAAASLVALSRADRTRGARLACESLPSLRFQPLPGSLSEAREIGSLWKEDSHGLGPRREEAILITGAEASEHNFKTLAPGRRVLHLATHGFLLQGPCDPEGPSPVDAPAPGHKRLLENPLLFSGLALAAANRRHETLSAGGGEDGILFAEEIPSLDLSGVQWVVLSACDTGLGEIRPGEGVLGLRRAFEIAGVHTLIMSLWKVEDDATRDWMRQLYQARLAGLSTAESLHRASLAILDQRRRAGRSDHPYYWGGFVAAGDWR